jgi:hypothetical protein
MLKRLVVNGAAARAGIDANAAMDRMENAVKRERDCIKASGKGSGG